MKKQYFFFLAVLLILSGTVSAQKKWNYQLSLGGNLQSGNVNAQTLNTSGSVSRNDSTLAFDAGYGIVYGEKDGEVYDRGLTANMKFDLFQYDRWSPFVSASYLNNKFKGYEYKVSLLGGVKYRIYTLPKVCDYSVSAAFVYDFVEYVGTTDLATQMARLSLRLKIKQKIGNVVSINHTTFYQPSFTDFSGDYIVTSVTKFENKLSDKLFFDLGFNYEYRSLVPEGIEKQDIITTATLRLKF